MAKLVYTDQSGREITEMLGPDSPVVTVGRAKDCTIRSNRKSVSRRHAEFHYNGGNVEVVDLDSSNGTYIIVDNRRKPVDDPEPLTHRDEIWCGDFILYFMDEKAELDVDPEPVETGGVEAGSNSPVSGSQPPVSTDKAGAGAQGSADGPPPPQSGGVGGGVSTGRDQSGPSSGDGPVDQRGPQAVTGPPSSPEGSGVSADSVGPSGGEAGISESTGAVGDEVERLRSEKESIQALADRQTRRAEELEQQLEETRNELEQARAELEEARSGPDHSREVERLEDELEDKRRDLEMLETELEREVEAGQRLQDSLDEYEQQIESLEADRDRLQKQLEELRAERDDLKARLDEGPTDTGGDAPVSAGEVDRIAELAGELDRMVDAMRRTDLDELSTVDRVRLESAIRETKPSDVLDEILQIVGAGED